MHFSAKCNSGRIAIQWFHIKHYLDYQYTKFQPYTSRVQKMSVFARYATLVPRLIVLLQSIRSGPNIVCNDLLNRARVGGFFFTFDVGHFNFSKKMQASFNMDHVFGSLAVKLPNNYSACPIQLTR